MAFLADVNYLVALLYDGHPHSPRATAWLEQQEDPANIILCRVSQMGVLRVLSNKAWLKDEVKAAAEIWDAWDLLASDPRFIEVGEPPDLERHWRRLTYPLPKGQFAETDAYLASFACALGAHVLTFDQGFRKFKGLDAVVLQG